MTRRFAVVKGSAVENVIVWDGEAPWNKPDGAELIELVESASVSPGFIFEAGAFRDPRPQGSNAEALAALEAKAAETAQRLGFNGDPGETVTL